MEYSDSTEGVGPEAIESLKLPVVFDEATQVTALDIDAFLTQDERPVATLNAKVAAHRDIALSHLLTHRGTQIFDINLFHWLGLPLYSKRRQRSQLLDQSRPRRSPLWARLDLTSYCHGEQGLTARRNAVQFQPASQRERTERPVF
jgi:hypothetical protein